MIVAGVRPTTVEYGRGTGAAGCFLKLFSDIF